MEKSQVSFRLDKDLHEFLLVYAKENRMTLTQVLIKIIFDFSKREAGRVEPKTGGS